MVRRGVAPAVLLLASVSLVPVVASASSAGSVAAAAVRAEPRAAAESVPRSWVRNEAELRAAWTDPRRTRIDLAADITLRDCHTGDPIRESPYPLLLDGHGHTVRQTCFEKRLLRQDGTGYLDLRHVTLTRGGADGPGAALTSRGEIILWDTVIRQNLSEEPGGGVFSMRRVTVHDSHINGNLANDDGGGVYARRGGVEIYDSVLSNNLVDGSGGAVASTGDILVVRSRVDGNTTDGDGGALYADEDGDVTVIDSLIDGSDADGPGGAIFTLDGDVAVHGSTLLGNRADDRGGAISGEADVLLVNSTVARNLAVAHAGGGVWARGNLTVVNSTVTNNYAEGEGGGVLAAGRTTLISSTLTDNIGSVGADVGSAGPLTAFASIIGPPETAGVTGDTLPTRRACRVYEAVSRGYNFVNDDSCELHRGSDVLGDDPELQQLEDDPLGFVLEPGPGSPVRGRIPPGSCRGELPDPTPARHLLDPYVDWDDVLSQDALGNPRDTGVPCDIGAVQTLPGARPQPRHDDHSLEMPPESDSAAVAPSTAADLGAAVGALLARADDDRAAGTRGRLELLERQLRRLLREARRFDVLESCLTPVEVDQVGDVRHRWGYLYDERDGTGPDHRPALARHQGSGPPDLRLLDLSPATRCLSAAPDPNGTGASARGTGPGVGTLLKRLERLEVLHARVERKADRFDEWESCVSWLPVTEAGDKRQNLGYRLSGNRYRPALDVDATEWDDPDYELLAFLGRDRPYGERECSSEPGESVDRAVPPRDGARRTQPDDQPDDPRAELRAGVRALEEDVEDLVEPVEEITRFDECMYTVGVQERDGYRYRGARGQRQERSAMSFDLRGPALPPLNVLAFSGEEPPQIECNEDAAGQSTDE